MVPRVVAARRLCYVSIIILLGLPLYFSTGYGFSLWKAVLLALVDSLLVAASLIVEDERVFGVIEGLLIAGGLAVIYIPAALIPALVHLPWLFLLVYLDVSAWKGRASRSGVVAAALFSAVFYAAVAAALGVRVDEIILVEAPLALGLVVYVLGGGLAAVGGGAVFSWGAVVLARFGGVGPVYLVVTGLLVFLAGLEGGDFYREIKKRLV